MENKKSFAWQQKIGLGAGLIFIALLGTFIVQKRYHSLFSSFSQLQELKTSSTPSPSESPSFYKTPMSPRNYNPEGMFFAPIGYPQEMTNIAEQKLIPMKCTYPLSCSAPYDHCTFNTSDADTALPQELKDLEVLLIVKNASELLSHAKEKEEIQALSICDTGDNQKVLSYGIVGSSSSSAGQEFIGIVNKDNSIHQIALLQSSSHSFTCSTPLQLTTDQDLYLQCKSKEGERYKRSIYKVNLKTEKVTAVIKCSFQFDHNGGGDFDCE